MTTEVNFI